MSSQDKKTPPSEAIRENEAVRPEPAPQPPSPRSKKDLGADLHWAKKDRGLDEMLADTYPASDPPSSMNVN